MEFAAICLRNALLLLPEHQQQELKTENSSKNSSQSGSTESGSENSDACRSDTSVHPTYLLQKDSDAFLTRWFQTIFLFFHKVFLFVLYSQHISPVIMFKNCTKSHNLCVNMYLLLNLKCTLSAAYWGGLYNLESLISVIMSRNEDRNIHSLVLCKSGTFSALYNYDGKTKNRSYWYCT